MKIKLFLLLLLPFSIYAQSFLEVKRYKPYLAIAQNATQKLITLRSFQSDGKKYFLLVNPDNLETTIDWAGNYQVSKIEMGNLLALFKNTNYVKYLESASRNSTRLQNAGIIHSSAEKQGIALTIDLCPSTKPLDRVIFKTLFDALFNKENGVPIGLSVSGKWMLHHADDLLWLKQLGDSGKLKITWINHSFNHYVNSLPLKDNFLLATNTDINKEVLENEVLMISNHLVPSVFFRFPGLVSDQVIFNKMLSLGLVPIGTDAWLAKGEHPTLGSIVLIHGNGNEEAGVNDFIKLMKSESTLIKDKKWFLYDLKNGI